MAFNTITILISILTISTIPILTILAPIVAYKTIYITGITIYSNIIAINTIDNTIEVYSSL